MTRMKGALPEGNGLTPLNPLMVTDPHRKFLVVAVIETDSIKTNVDTGIQEATVRLRTIEAITTDDAGRAEQLLRRAREKRTGQEELPIELEDELTEILKSVDLETGEIRDSEDTANDGDESFEDQVRDVVRGAVQNLNDQGIDVSFVEPGQPGVSRVSDPEPDLLRRAAELVITTQFGSVSMLQRKLRIGYARAVRLGDELEHHGILSSAEHGKTRDVLIKPEGLEQALSALPDTAGDS
jgi:DNA segregation ATPase FtsK/SpoIIIE-like protein